MSALAQNDLTSASKLVKERLAISTVGKQIDLSFASDEKHATLLERVLLAFELAAIEGLDELSRPSGENSELRTQAIVASFCATEILRLLPPPHRCLNRVFFVFRLSTIAYCGGRSSDLRRWYKENKVFLEIPNIPDDSWDHHLLYQLFDCWIRLFRKHGWENLYEISNSIIPRLREDQEQFEDRYLSNGTPAEKKTMARRLVALYHWAKATEIVAIYILEGKPANPFALIEKHFDAAVTATMASGDVQHLMTLRWLYAATRIMITNSLWWTTRSVNS